MRKLQTKFSFFRFGSSFQIQPLLITWFKLDKSSVGVCFSREELEQFSNYVQSRPNNFQILLDYECHENSANFSYNRILLDKSIHLPHLLVIAKNPQVYDKGEIFGCMDVVILNSHQMDDHDYELSFDVLGHVEL